MLFQKNKTRKTIFLEEGNEPSIAEWLEEGEGETEGQLAIDVFQTDSQIVIKSTIAGTKPEDLKVSLHNDLLTIKGRRSLDEDIAEEDYLYRECYWGSFSRSIILPSEVDSKRVEAELENGVLTIKLYKSQPDNIEIKVKEE
jgi:HSP20 family protein